MGSEHATAVHERAPAPVLEPPVPTPEAVASVPLPGLAVRRQVADPLGGSDVDAETERELSAPRAGRALDSNLRRTMESHLGTDLGDVQLHTDARASRLSAGLGAQAFTHGSDVYFAGGAPDTSSAEGQHLLAHELAHVAQRKSGRDRGSAGAGTTVGRADDPLEREADASADQVVGALRRQTQAKPDHDGCGCGEHR